MAVVFVGFLKWRLAPTEVTYHYERATPTNQGKICYEGQGCWVPVVPH